MFLDADGGRKSDDDGGRHLIKGAKDVYYPGAPHGLTATHQDQVNSELLAFLRSSPRLREVG